MALFSNNRITNIETISFGSIIMSSSIIKDNRIAFIKISNTFTLMKLKNEIKKIIIKIYILTSGLHKYMRHEF